MSVDQYGQGLLTDTVARSAENLTEALHEDVYGDQHGFSARRAWSFLWPKLIAIGIVIAVWQIAIEVNWKPDYVFPSPSETLRTFWGIVTGTRADSHLWGSLETTLRRSVYGYGLALIVGTLIGIAVVQWRVVRSGVSSLIAGMQTMPSIAWFPFAILLFGVTQKTMLFVVVLGAAPSVASGVIAGIDEVPPPLLRAGKMIGARGINRYRYIVLPAAMPAYVQGLRQGWAFAWRALLAGELLVSVAGVTSLGGDLKLAADGGQASLVFALMIVILIFGMVIDGVFSVLTSRIRRNRGLTGAAMD